MTAQRGKNLLLKADTDGLGSFATVAGLRARSVAFNAETIDVTDSESVGQWRELLDGGAIRSATVTGTGIFKDAASDETVRGYFFAGTIRDWQIVVPDFGTVEGPFQVTALEYAGDHDGELSFELSLASAGALTFTPG